MILFYINVVLAAKDVSGVKGKNSERKALHFDDVSDFDDVVEPSNEHFGYEVLNDAQYIQIPSGKSVIMSGDNRDYESNQPYPQKYKNKPFLNYKFKYPKPRKVKTKYRCADGNYGKRCGPINRFRVVENAHSNLTYKVDHLNATQPTRQRFAFKFMPERLLLKRKYKSLPKYNFQPFENVDDDIQATDRRKRNSKTDKIIELSDEILKSKKLQQDIVLNQINARAQSMLTNQSLTALLKSITLNPLKPVTFSSVPSYLPMTQPTSAHVQTTESTLNVQQPIRAVAVSLLPKFDETTPRPVAPLWYTTSVNPLAWEDSFLNGIYKNKIDGEAKHNPHEKNIKAFNPNVYAMFEKNKRCIGNCKSSMNHTALKKPKKAVRSFNRTDDEVLKCLEHHLNQSNCLLRYLYHTATGVNPTEVTQIEAQTTNNVETGGGNGGSPTDSNPFGGITKNVENAGVSAAEQEVTAQKAIATNVNLVITPLPSTEASNINTSKSASDETNTATPETLENESKTAVNNTEGCAAPAGPSKAAPAGSPVAGAAGSPPVAGAVATSAVVAAGSPTSAGSEPPSNVPSSSTVAFLNSSSVPELIKVCAQMLKSKSPEAFTDQISGDNGTSNFLFGSSTTPGVGGGDGAGVANASVGTGTTQVWLESEKVARAEATKKPSVHRKRSSGDSSKDVLVPEVIRDLEKDLVLIDELQRLLDSLKDIDGGGSRAVRKYSDGKSSRTSRNTTKTKTTCTTTECCNKAKSTRPPFTTDNITSSSNNAFDEKKLKDVLENASKALDAAASNLHYPDVDLKTNKVFDDPLKIGGEDNSEAVVTQQPSAPPGGAGNMQLNQINNVLQSIHDIFGGKLLHLQEPSPEENDLRSRRDYDLFKIQEEVSEASTDANDANTLSKEKRFLFKKGRKKKNKRKQVWKKLHGRELQPLPFLGRTHQNSLSTTRNV